MISSYQRLRMEENLIYKDLHFNGKEWDEDSIRIINDMLEVWDSAHRIIICHPNCVFAQKPINKEVRDFDKIDWQNLAKDFEINDDNSYASFMIESNDSFKYIHRRFRHELFENKKVQPPRHLVVLEQDGLGGNLVRGIFKATKEKLQVAENPLYEKYKPKSIFDKTLRLSSDDVKSLDAFIALKYNHDHSPEH